MGRSDLEMIFLLPEDIGEQKNQSSIGLKVLLKTSQLRHGAFKQPIVCEYGKVKEVYPTIAEF